MKNYKNVNLPDLKVGASDDSSSEGFTSPSTEKKSAIPTLTSEISFGLLKKDELIDFNKVNFRNLIVNFLMVKKNV
jgi:hypothetical protein